MIALADLEFLPYLNAEGQLIDEFDGKVGVYAIFDRDKALQFIGYSRDVSLSLKQHLVRQPQHCYWIKVETIDRPSRTLLEDIRAAWIAENNEIPAGNGVDEPLWNQPIDAKIQMTSDERKTYEGGDELIKVKTLKQVARRVEVEVMAAVEARGARMNLRFDPKLKEKGLLNL
jgi:hypothetical protein